MRAEREGRRANDRLLRVLGRQTSIGSLDALVGALQPIASTVPLGKTAIGLDANVFLRLGGHKKSSDVFDYLASAHGAPLVLPGQTIQEFWNNQLQVVDPIASVIRKKFDPLRADIAKVDVKFGDYRGEFEALAENFSNLIDRFSADHGHVYDEATARRVLVLLEILQSKAIVPYAPRESLRDIAIERKKSKTPPGFKDDGDGDFYVWADFLTGLIEARRRGMTFDRVALISNEQKPDWIRGRMPHPILIAEIQAMFDVPFEIWNIEMLVDAVTAVT